MYSPDLIQRIYFERDKGSNTNFEKVFNDLRRHDFDFTNQFDLDEKTISWTCFESKKYYDIIKEPGNYIYFYLWNTELKFEIIIPGHTEVDELKNKIIERTPYFHSVWIIGEFFPGINYVGHRPLKINLQHVKRVDFGPISKLNFGFKKLLTQYSTLKKPIFEPVDYPKEAEQRWKKIVEKRKD